MNLKITTLVAAVSGLLLASAGPAAATTLTGAGGATLGSGTTITSEAEGATIFHLAFGEIVCLDSAATDQTSNTGSSTETVKTKWSVKFTRCNGLVKVIVSGTREIHTALWNNGRVTSSTLEITIEYFGTHCIYKTSSTEIGTITGSANTGGNATVDISATLPRTGGISGAFCGSTATWTGSYKVTSPSTLNID